MGLDLYSMTVNAGGGAALPASQGGMTYPEAAAPFEEIIAKTATANIVKWLSPGRRKLLASPLTELDGGNDGGTWAVANAFVLRTDPVAALLGFFHHVRSTGAGVLSTLAAPLTSYTKLYIYRATDTTSANGIGGFGSSTYRNGDYHSASILNVAHGTTDVTTFSISLGSGWRAIMITFDGSTKACNAYVDSTTALTATAKATKDNLPSTGLGIAVGSLADGATPAAADSGMCVVWNTVLTTAQIAAVMGAAINLKGLMP